MHVRSPSTTRHAWLGAGACLLGCACGTVRNVAVNAADAITQSAVRVGVVGSVGVAESLEVADLGAALRLSATTLGANVDVWADGGMRRTHLTPSVLPTPRFLGVGGRWNFFGGYPRPQGGVAFSREWYGGAARGAGWQGGLAVTTSAGRGQRAVFEVSWDQRRLDGQDLSSVRLSFGTLLRLGLPRFSRRDSVPHNVSWSAVDANGLPLNPRWVRTRPRSDRLCRFWYAQSSDLPSLIYRGECTDQPITLNQLSPRQEKSGGLSCSQRDAEPHIRGHVNWFEITQIGRLRWKSFVHPGDHDLTFWLEAEGIVNYGSVRVNRPHRSEIGDPARVIELEFSGEETVRRFDPSLAGTPWRPIIDVVRRVPGAERAARDLLRDRLAVVTGVLGVDGIHHYQTEIHPVFALAVDASDAADGPEHAWMVLLRNSGNEGECGLGILPWRSDSANGAHRVYLLEIPWEPGADSVQVLPSSTFGRLNALPATLAVELDRNLAVRLVVGLPEPTGKSSRAGIYGTIRLRWWNDGQPLTPGARAAVADTAPRQDGPGDAHGRSPKPEADGSPAAMPADTLRVGIDSVRIVARARRSPAAFLRRALEVFRDH